MSGTDSARADYPFLRGGGQMGKLIRALDWTANPLGPPGEWPAALKHAVSIMLKNSFPVLICWGPDYLQLYNDAFRPINGATKHPQAVGGSARDTYREIWDTIGPMFADVMDGKTHGFPDFMVKLDRDGQPEECYFDFSYSPLADLDGAIEGVLVVCVETTDKIKSIREYKAGEELRKAREEQLQLLIDMLPASVVVIRGQDLEVEMINRSNLEYWNKTPSEVIGRPFLKILPELADQPFAGQLRHVMATGEVIDVKESPVLFANEDGTTRETFVDYTYQPLTDSQGQRNGVLVMSFEITDRVAARRLLEQYAAELQSVNDRLTDSNRDLALSEERFKYLIREAPVAIGVLSGRELVISSANSKLLEVWGKPPATIGLTLARALPEIQGQPFLQILDEVYTSGKPFFADEIRALLEHQGDLKEYFFNLVYQPIQLDPGNTTDILMVAVDVTTQVNARRDLQKINEKMATSTSRLRMAIESTNLGTWDYQPHTGELYWSRECRAIYGIPDGQPATFGSFTEQLHPQDRNWVQKAIAKAIDPKKGGSYDLSFRIIRFDTGITRWVKVNGSVFFDQGQATRFIGTVLDITEIKEAEEKSAKLAAIIESSDDAIISKTLDSVITSWNQGAQRIFGYQEAEMVGETIYKLIPTDRHEEEPQILARLRSGERVQHFETKRQTKDGRLIDVSLTISPVKDTNGNVIGLSKIARDITEKKLDETRKNDFIGMVSHELKTPLTSLNALLQMASQKLKNSEDGFLTGAMEKANIQVKRMTAMINGFLNIARLESGKMHIEKQPFEIERLIADMIGEARLTARTHTLHFTQSAQTMVNADRDKIGSVISNFISNAIKYSPRQKQIEIACTGKDGELIVSVADHGMGINREHLDKIFDRYYRVETSHTQHISGFGIGLYLSSEIIARHNGRVWAESESGAGSTFYFSLPLV